MRISLVEVRYIQAGRRFLSCNVLCKMMSKAKHRLQIIIFSLDLCLEYQGTPLRLLADVGVNSGYIVGSAWFSFRGRGGPPMFRAMLLMPSQAHSRDSAATEVQPTPPVDDDAFDFYHFCHILRTGRARPDSDVTCSSSTTTV